MEKLIHTTDGKLVSENPFAPGTRVKYKSKDWKGVIVGERNGIKAPAHQVYVQWDQDTGLGGVFSATKRNLMVIGEE